LHREVREQLGRSVEVVEQVGVLELIFELGGQPGRRDWLGR